MSANPNHLDTIAAALQRLALAGNPRELWGYAEIAVYSKYEFNYVANIITNLPDFPKPIRTVNERSQPRYVAGQVMEWFEARQEKP